MASTFAKKAMQQGKASIKTFAKNIPQGTSLYFLASDRQAERATANLQIAFRRLIPPPAVPFLETFTGANSTIPRLWIKDGAPTSIDTNKLAVGCTSNSVGGKVRFRYKLSGDFDIETEGSLTYTSGNSFFTGLVVSCTALPNYNMFIGIGDNGATYSGGYVNNVIYEDYVAAGSKFKLTRTGNIFARFYWNGSSWISAGATKDLTAGFGKTTISFMTWTWANRTVWGAFDNFKVNSGVIKGD